MADESTIFLDSSPEEDNDDGKDDDYLPPSKVKKVPAKRKPRKAAQCKPVAVIDLVQSPIVVTLDGDDSSKAAPPPDKPARGGRKRLAGDTATREAKKARPNTPKRKVVAKKQTDAAAISRRRKAAAGIPAPVPGSSLEISTEPPTFKGVLLGKRPPGASSPILIPDNELKQEGNTTSTGKFLSGSPDEAIDVDAEWEARYGWKVDMVVASAVHVGVDVVRNVVDMLSKDCTIPFIARYRREQTGGLAADSLQDIQQAYTNLLQVKKKAQTILTKLAQEKKGDIATKKLILSARSVEELDHLYAPFKESKARTHAQRAKSLGLEETANQIIKGEATVESICPETLVKPDVKGLESIGKVLLGWQHIIAEFLSKSRAVLDYLSNMSQSPQIQLCAARSSSAGKKANEAAATGKPVANDGKYENYFEFSKPLRLVLPHHVMAINRGESQKELTVKVLLPDHLPKLAKDFCATVIRQQGARMVGETQALIWRAVEDAYSRLLEPLVIRSVRSRLTKEAEKASVNVFRTNLRQLLLSPPVRGHAVLGIDPGYKHGCKLAAVSPSGKLLKDGVIHPHANPASRSAAADTLRRMVVTYNCDLIALGNGTACRETEAFLSDLIQRGVFEPVKVKFCTVDESGVSIYSVTKEAEAELPGVDPNIRSAVGIARRLQDPLLEYVKVDPKHLGIGMYQHDISESVLKDALEGVVVECVSFVGVDINVCTETTLKKVSGLNARTARNIVEWRETNGAFRNRKQILDVKHLGTKGFEQCAGFIKIFPNTAHAVRQTAPQQEAKARKGKKNLADNFEPLDMTIIHPESYHFADLLISHLNLNKADIGKPHFISTVKAEAAKQGVNHFVNILGGSVQTMQLILDALQQSVEYDIRSEQHQPLFKSGVVSLNELQVHQELTGKVKNCTHFGAFVDIGVGKDGLIHSSNMRGFTVNLGDRVTVSVLSIDIPKGRISLKLLRKG